MFIKKSEVALLVSDKNNSFVKFLKLYFTEKNLLVRVFEGRNALYLYLLTHNPEAILVSRQIKSNNHKQVVNWIRNKYKTVTVLFDEVVSGQNINASFLDVLGKAGPVPSGVLQNKGSSLKSILDLSETDGNKLDKQFALAIDDILASIDRKKEINKQKESEHKLANLVAKRIQLDKKRSETTSDQTYMLPVTDHQFSGFVMLDTDDKALAGDFKHILGVKAEEVLKSGYGVNNKIKKEFIGSVKGENNVYAFDCHLPDFVIIESNGKLEVDASYFVDENPVEFDVYIHMDHQNSDYHYLSPGSSFSESQIKKLKFNSKKVRVRPEDRLKLLTHLNISHMIKISNEL